MPQIKGLINISLTNIIIYIEANINKNKPVLLHEQVLFNYHYTTTVAKGQRGDVPNIETHEITIRKLYIAIGDCAVLQTGNQTITLNIQKSLNRDLEDGTTMIHKIPYHIELFLIDLLYRELIAREVIEPIQVHYAVSNMPF